jgi:membrane protease YdiL (CAAX protease family)
MSATAALQPRELPSSGAGLLAVAKRHPLVAYFVLAYVLTWVFVVPIALSQRGVGWIALPDSLLLVLFVLGTFAGPAPAAFVLTGLIDGRDGVRALLRRMVQWRVGIGWYLLVIVGYPVVTLAVVGLPLGAAPLNALLSNPGLIVSSYLPGIAIGLIFPSLGEEPGWRGFALPRLQRLYGPLVASLILGALHALWHTPAYFVRGAISDNGFDLGVFVGNSLGIMAFTFVWTWLFNNTSGSVLFAMLMHATSNATSQLFGQLPDADAGLWGRLYPVLLALLLIAATRGQLAYRRRIHGQPDPKGDNT